MQPARIAAVSVYCSSSNTVHQDYFRAARDIGTAIARASRVLIYGGGKVGLMGETARAARAANGRVVGIITQTLIDAEQMDPENHEVVVVETMRERKRLLEQRADAMIVLPGGLGTLEEFFEVLVGRLLGEHHKPIIIFNPRDPDAQDHAGFYDPMLSMIDHMIAGRFAKPGVRTLFTVCKSAAEVAEALNQAERQPRIPADRKTLVPSA